MTQWPGQLVSAAPSASPQAPETAQPWPGQAVGQEQRPRAQARRSAPQGNQSAPQSAPAYSGPLNENGITDAEQIDALMAQGYTREQAEEITYDPGMYPAQPAEAPIMADAGDEVFLARYAEQGFEGQPFSEPGAAFEYGNEPLVVDRGVTRQNGTVYTTNQDGQLVPLASEADWDSLPREERQARFRQVSNGRSPEYLNLYEEARSRAGNIPDRLLSLTGGATFGGSGLIDEIIGGVDFLASGGNALAAQAARDAVRDEQAQYAADKPLENLAYQFGGGLLTPGLNAGGSWISGATGAARTARAGLLGAGYGAASGLADSEGNLIERADDAALSGAVGAATGGLLDAAMVRTLDRNAARQANPSPARQLSRRGINLTYGQAAGGPLQRIEDGLTSIPIMGDSIRDAQRRGLLDFDRVATNEALAPVGGLLADTSGRAGVRAADDVINQAYEAAKRGVQVSDDQAFGQAVTQALRPDGLPQSIQTNLNAVVEDALGPLRRGTIDGDGWKRIDSRLASDIRAAETASASAPEQRLLRDRLQEVRDAYRDLLARQNGQETRDAFDAADLAEAQYRLVRRASSDVASAGRGGNASPQTLNRAVVASNSDRRVSRGESLLQDLTDDAMQVLPSTVPDSGTPLRGLLSVAGIGGGAATVGADPAAVLAGVAGVLGGSTAYSRPVLNAFNAVYRATDRQSATTALAEIQRAAGRNPALIPYYEAAAQRVLDLFPSQSQEQAPVGGGMLSPTSP